MPILKWALKSPAAGHCAFLWKMPLFSIFYFSSTKSAWKKYLKKREFKIHVDVNLEHISQIYISKIANWTSLMFKKSYIYIYKFFILFRKVGLTTWMDIITREGPDIQPIYLDGYHNKRMTRYPAFLIRWKSYQERDQISSPTS